MRILYVTYGLPFPPDAGARIRDFELIRRVAREAEVFVCSLVNTPEELSHLPALRRHVAGVETCEAWPRGPWGWAAAGARGLLARRPAATIPFHFPALASRIRDLVERRHVDVVQIEHSIMAPYREAVPHGRCRTILSFHNVASRQYRRMARLAPLDVVGWGKAAVMQRWEPRLAARFDHCLAVSRPERDLLHRGDPTLPITVVENGVDTEAYRPLGEAPEGHDLLFVGVMGYPPNADAARYLCEAILPHVRRRVADARLFLVGHAPPPSVRRLHDGRHVVVTGTVPDVRPFYRRARLCVTPLRAGGGTRVKILEAMALGRAVVSTTLGCEGLDVVDGVDLAIADDPAQLASRIVGLLGDRSLRDAMVRRARRRVERRHSWDTIAGQLLGLYRDLTRAPAPARALRGDGARPR